MPQEQPGLSRDATSIETESTVALLKEAGELGVSMATEPLTKLAFGWHPPSRASVSLLLTPTYLTQYEVSEHTQGVTLQRLIAKPFLLTCGKVKL